MRAALFVLSLTLLPCPYDIAQEAQTPPPAAAPKPAPLPLPAAITSPRKDDTAMPGVPQTAAEKAAAQGDSSQQQSPAQNTAPQPGAPLATTTGNPVIPGASPANAANTITRTVRLVVLDMVVVDKDGNAVTGLTRDQFHVTESDEPQQIRNFDPPGKYTPDPAITIDSTADLDRLAPRAPVNIVLLDEFNTRFEDMAFARYSLEKWLKKQPDKLDTPTMLVAVDLQHFTVLRDYTQNKAEILNSLNHHFVAYPWQAHQFAWIAERYSTAFLTLRRVAEAVVGHPGHKNMIWIGRGFPSASRSRFSVDDESRINSAVQLTVNELRDARVTLYTIDPAGLMIDPGAYGMETALFNPFGGDPDFENLARATGGRTLHGRNDVDAQIGKSIRDGASIYTLTYRPTDTDRDYAKFRKIKVTVDRPGVMVITRQGYFLERGPARMNPTTGQINRQLATELLGAESSNMVYDAVPFTVTASGPTPDDYIIHVDSRGLVWTYATDTEPRKCKVILMVSTFDRKGKELGRDAKQMVARAPANSPPAGRIEVPLNVPYKLAANPKAVRARFVVRVDATGRMGTADLPLGQAGATAKSSSQPATATPPPPPAQAAPAP